MGISMHKMVATGRATCRICNKKIEKGLTCIVANAWRGSGQAHANEADCTGVNWRQRLKR
jgi:hypothetical protein